MQMYERWERGNELAAYSMPLKHAPVAAFKGKQRYSDWHKFFGCMAKVMKEQQLRSMEEAAQWMDNHRCDKSVASYVRNTIRAAAQPRKQAPSVA